MKTQVFKSESRGTAHYGWLNAKYMFSFANYYNPERMQFGALRVWNDDIIAAGKGFDTHPHDNMEIITVPLHGAVLHKDSMGHESIIGENEVQVMSAGTGIFHSEYNASESEKLNLFQLWVFPSKRNIKPRYDQAFFEPKDSIDKWQRLVSPTGNPGLTIQQEAWVHRAHITQTNQLHYKMNEGRGGSILMVVSGEVVVNNMKLAERDSIAIQGVEGFAVEALEDAQVLCVEIPLNP